MDELLAQIELIRTAKVARPATISGIASETASLLSRIRASRSTAEQRSQQNQRNTLERMERQQAEQRRQETWAKACFPRRHRERLGSLAPWPEDIGGDAWATVLRGGVVGLIGTRGGGKTQLATTIAHSWVMGCGRDAFYTTAGDLFQSMRRDIGENKEGDTINRRAKVALLVIDDLQDRMDTANESKWLTRLMDKRYQELRPTILIANMTLPAFTEALGASVVDRIKEGGTVFECDWPSKRDAEEKV